MSKKHHSGCKPKRSHPARTATDWTRKIFLAARAAYEESQKEESIALSSTSQRLAEVVAQALDTGTDRHVLRAIENLQEANLEEAAEMVFHWGCDDASTHSVIIQKTDAQEPGEFEIFVVPVLFVAGAGAEIPTVIPSQKPVTADRLSSADRCATCLHRHHLLGQGASVVLLPALYSYHDLPSTWSEQRSMMRKIFLKKIVQRSGLELPSPVEVHEQPYSSLHFEIFAITFSLVSPAGRMAPPMVGVMTPLKSVEIGVSNGVKIGRFLPLSQPASWAPRVGVGEHGNSRLPG
ncbi:hypothetical protein [Acidithiobacillus caldus]|uniref:hypothetical protein n=1 Tax=Acidithiobacillus caldus TaxID=33059 RepID=UPI0013010504|nr:hypothetical protein [Acidithiobacillus caldus]